MRQAGGGQVRASEGLGQLPLVRVGSVSASAAAGTEETHKTTAGATDSKPSGPLPGPEDQNSAGWQCKVCASGLSIVPWGAAPTRGPLPQPVRPRSHTGPPPIPASLSGTPGPGPQGREQVPRAFRVFRVWVGGGRGGPGTSVYLSRVPGRGRRHQTWWADWTPGPVVRVPGPARAALAASPSCGPATVQQGRRLLAPLLGRVKSVWTQNCETSSRVSEARSRYLGLGEEAGGSPARVGLATSGRASFEAFIGEQRGSATLCILGNVVPTDPRPGARDFLQRRFKVWWEWCREKQMAWASLPL